MKCLAQSKGSMNVIFLSPLLGRSSVIISLQHLGCGGTGWSDSSGSTTG